MALASPREAECPPGDELPFTTLGDVNRLGSRYCEEPLAPQNLAHIQLYRAYRMRCLATTLRILRDCAPPTRSVVTVRLKRLQSIRRKITRPGTNFGLGTLDDVIGIRVICQSVSEAIALSDRIALSPHLHRTKNYLERPADTGYRGIHHIMRFEQPASTRHRLPVRYEVQVRTYLQHCWAVWSEAQGEKVKIGQGDPSRQDELRRVSRELAQWEEQNPACVQEDLLEYSGSRTIAVSWRPAYGPATPFFFRDAGDAVAWLHHLETTLPAEKDNALLLVGIADPENVERALRLTHPIYMGVRPVHPGLYIPSVAP